MLLTYNIFCNNLQAEAADFFENSRGSWILFNPRQGAWDPNKKGEMDYQVNWELEHLEDADYILMNILPDSKSPITLLELGLFARSGKLYVVCTEGFTDMTMSGLLARNTACLSMLH